MWALLPSNTVSIPTGLYTGLRYILYISTGDTRKPTCQLCRHLGTQCTYPSIRPGPKRKPRNKDVLQTGCATSTTERSSLYDTSGPLGLESTTGVEVPGGSEKYNADDLGGWMATSNWPHHPNMCDISPMINIEQTLDFNDVLPVSENAIEDLLFGCSSNLFTPIQLLAQHSRSDLPLPPIEVINHLVNVFFVAV